MCHEWYMIFLANRRRQLNGNKIMIYKTLVRILYVMSSSRRRGSRKSSIILDSRLRGNDGSWVDSRLRGNDGSWVDSRLRGNDDSWLYTNTNGVFYKKAKMQQIQGIQSKHGMIYSVAGLVLILLGFFCININAFPAQFHPNPLQAQAMQTQEFQATKRKTFDAVMTVFQDKGYMVQNSDYNSGYISARRAGGQGVSVTATITSSKKGKDTFSKVRLSYVTPRSQISDPSFYQQIFNDIRQQLFVGDAMQ